MWNTCGARSLLMPPPFESYHAGAAGAQSDTEEAGEEKAMSAPGGLKELGWYMPPEFVDDKLFQWIVEMHSLDDCEGFEGNRELVDIRN